MNEMDKYVEHVMEMIASGGIDKEKIKSKLISNWSELEMKAERLERVHTIDSKGISDIMEPCRLRRSSTKR